MAKSISRRLADSASPTGAIDGTLSTAAQTNITSVGTLSALEVSGTLTSTGKITADAGIDIDNFNIDGTTIALSSGSMALTTAVNLDLNMTGVININDTSDPPSTGEQGGSGSQDTGASIGLTQNDGNLTLRLDKLGKNTVFQHNGVMGTVGFNVDSLSLNAYGATVAVPLTVTNKIYATGLDINDVGTVYTGAGLGKGTIHLDPNSATDFAGNAITFGASDAHNGQTAQAGIYTRTDGTLGSEMHLSTTESYAAGSRTGIKISNYGNVTVPRGYMSAKQPAAIAVGVGAWHSSYTAAGWNELHTLCAFTAYQNSVGSPWSNSTGRFTAPIAGYYLCSASVYALQSAAHAHGVSYVHPVWAKNGVQNVHGTTPYQIYGYNDTAANSYATGIGRTDIVYCSAGDYITMQLFIAASGWQFYRGYSSVSFCLLSAA